MKKLILFITILGIFSCRKDPVLSNSAAEVKNHIETSDVEVRFTNVSDNKILELSPDLPYTSTTTVYVNAHSDTFSVSKLKYYISNIRLKKADGSYYTEPESYHLINAADTVNKCSFIMKKVPVDNYISIEFMLGVDSLRNCDGAQTGDLDPVNDMFWTWIQGYIFFKFEGYSNQAPANVSHNLTFHIGGFSSPFKMMVNYNLPLPAVLANKADHPATIFMKTNVQECFRNPDTLDFSNYNFATSGSSSKFLAADYVDMFSVSAVKN